MSMNTTQRQPYLILLLIFSMMSVGLWSLLISTQSYAMSLQHSSMNHTPCHQVQTLAQPLQHTIAHDNAMHGLQHETQPIHTSDQPLHSQHNNCEQCADWHCMFSSASLVTRLDLPQQWLIQPLHQPQFNYARYTPQGELLRILRPPKA